MKNNLRVILAKQRKTVAELHNESGVSITTLTHIYYEKGNPKIETIAKIAKALNVSFDELLVK